MSDREMPHMAQRSWRKSSYSGSSGTNSCLEVSWQKSSYSGGSGTDNCVEVAFVDSAVGVRDSKNTSGPALAFSPAAWRGFVTTW
jgi:hypothetical protein